MRRATALVSLLLSIAAQGAGAALLPIAELVVDVSRSEAERETGPQDTVASPVERCETARKCGADDSSACLPEVAAMAATDADNSVRDCAYEALAAACDRGGREQLVRLAEAQRDGATAPLRRALAQCPSPAAAFAVDNSAGERMDAAFEEHDGPADDSAVAAATEPETVGDSETPEKEAGEGLSHEEGVDADADTGTEEVAEPVADAAADAVPETTEALPAKSVAPAPVDAVAAAAEAAVPVPRPSEWDAQWGAFEDWRERKANKPIVSLLRKLVVQQQVLRRLKAQHDEVKAANDAAVREPLAVPVPIYAQVTASFMFVKILDHAAGEALFSASDGLFVLRLSEGDSFHAYPGQLVQMTAHSLGERMRMSNGQRLPVFRSGSSPARTRVIPGHRPNRREEKKLALRVRALTGAASKARARALKPLAAGHFRLAGATKGAVAEVFVEDGILTHAVISDQATEEMVYCVYVDADLCPQVHQVVDANSFLEHKVSR